MTIEAGQGLAARRRRRRAKHLDAPLCVWDGDDGPGIRAAADAVGAIYQTISR